MKILTIGAGKMGAFFCDLLSFDHDVAVLETDPKRLRFTFNVERFATPEEVRGFEPELVINAATVKYTRRIQKRTPLHPGEMHPERHSIRQDRSAGVLRILRTSVRVEPPDVRTDIRLAEQSHQRERRGDKEGDCLGRVFFLDLYRRLHLNVVEYTFAEHDETISYSLSIPFASSLAFGASIKRQDAPGTTFKRHMAIARGLMSEDDFLISEILFNPESIDKIDMLIRNLDELRDIIARHDAEGMSRFIGQVRKNIE